MSQTTQITLRDIKAPLIAELLRITSMNDETKRTAFVSDIIRQLSQANVAVTVQSARSEYKMTLPEYNPATDGNYSEWLVSLNID